MGYELDENGYMSKNFELQTRHGKRKWRHAEDAGEVIKENFNINPYEVSMKSPAQIEKELLTKNDKVLLNSLTESAPYSILKERKSDF